MEIPIILLIFASRKERNIMSKTVKINKVEVPVEDVLQIRTVFVSDELQTEVKYRLFQPMYHEVVTLLPKDKGYQLELKVRKAMNKR